jgi:hypothetical protein
MRVNMSAIGSVIMSSPPLPTRLDDARDFPAESEEPEANSAQLELAVIPTSATANLAAATHADRELRCAV